MISRFENDILLLILVELINDRQAFKQFLMSSSIAYLINIYEQAQAIKSKRIFQTIEFSWSRYEFLDIARDNVQYILECVFTI